MQEKFTMVVLSKCSPRRLVEAPTRTVQTAGFVCSIVLASTRSNEFKTPSELCAIDGLARNHGRGLLEYPLGNLPVGLACFRCLELSRAPLF